jgi:hypothetical protein
MKCLTLAQPLPSLISHGVVHVLAMDWPTDHRGPIGLHAAREVDWELSHRPEVEHALHAAGRCVIDITQRGNPALGAIVGTATLIDVAPIHVLGDEGNHWAPHVCLDPDDGEAMVITDPEDDWVNNAGDQLPFGDFAPGRWAWILEDAKPTSERCPACLGSGHLCGHGPAGPACDACDWWGCEVCNVLGVCDPGR